VHVFLPAFHSARRLFAPWLIFLRRALNRSFVGLLSLTLLFSNTHRHKSFCQVARTNFTHRRSSQPTERFSVNPESQSFPLSGQQIAITHGSYSATIATVGASLRALTFEDRDLITTFPANLVRPCFHGSTLVPWPNRLAGGCYTYAGVNQQIPVNEPERNNALHGLATWENWDIIKTSTSSV